MKMKKGKVLILRTSNADGTSHGGFVWPKKGHVEAPDWKPTKECGNGLHGAQKGVGDSSLFNWSPDALWQIVEVDEATIIDLGGKVKFPAGNVIYTGDRAGATALIYAAYGQLPVIGGVQISDKKVCLTGGNGSTLTGGNRSTLCWRVWDGSHYRIHVAYVGEDGIKPNTPYQYINGKIIEVK